MSNSYRIRTQVGVDKSINVHLTQDFEFLEILSLKILESEIYTRQCSDYGVVIGRISINNGFGIPNCKVSIFVPLSNQDATNPIISDLYPYTSVSDLNDGGYRYNLLPYVKSYSNHVPTGSFFDKEDVLLNQSYIEVFDKYYKYTAVTNESGDFMIFGVPLGTQTLHIDVDLSDIGEFSLAPQDLIRTGLATETQVAGTKFRSSNNLNELPQIISINRIITVEPLWGQPDVCNIGINRTDFDLSAEANIVIQPTAIFMGSMFSDSNNLALKTRCKPKFKQGELCSLIAGPGEILALRQTIQQDAQGRPILEQYELDGGGQVIDDNGTWLIDLPMNLDYITTNEFGERVISNDPEVGIPTRGKYRFKIKWNQSNDLDENVKRAYFLVPNVREYGWNGPFINQTLQKKSYAFSLDWDDYADPQTAINCEDTFYQFSYNKVYTVSQLIDQYRKGSLANRIISIKNILDDVCESENNKFPTNDTSFRWDFIYLLYTFASYIFRPLLIILVALLHFFYLTVFVLRILVLPLLTAYFGLLTTIKSIQVGGALATVPPGFALAAALALELIPLFTAFAASLSINIILFKIKFRGINLPLLLYDQCEFCKCADGDESEDTDEGGSIQVSSPTLPPPPPPNASGILLTNFEGGLYNQDLIEDDFNYTNYNQFLSGYYIQYRENKIRSFSKIPISINSQYSYTPNAGADPVFGRATFFTRDITLAEQFNLFNVKSKYFDESSSNPGGGINQVYVSVEPTLNGGGYSYVNQSDPNIPYTTPSLYHTDNVIVLMMTPESLPLLSGGTILSFVSPNSTKDVNYSGASLNIYNTTSISGESIFANVNTSTVPISILHTLPNGSSRITTYTIPKPNSGNTNYHKFPTDIEYFQVITAMTYTDFVAKASTPASGPGSTILTNGFPQRVLAHQMAVNVNYLFQDGSTGTHIENITPLTSLENYQNQIIVILNRGVDPYSTRVNIRFDLGRIFGRVNPKFVSVEGNFKLNIPIQGNFKNVKHDNLTDNNSLDSYSNMRLYYDTFDYNPIQFTAYSSNLIQYYSSLSGGYSVFNHLQSNPGPFIPAENRGACQLANWFGFFSYPQLPLNISLPNYPEGVLTVNVDSLNFNPGQNEFIYRYTPRIGRFFLDSLSPNISNNPNTSTYQNGYFNGEIIEGGSVMNILAGKAPSFFSNTDYILVINEENNNGVTAYEDRTYSAPRYQNWVSINIQAGRRLVMRSDRHPTSDRLLETCGIAYNLQQNQNFAIYVIPDEGTFDVPQNTGGSSGIIQDGDTEAEDVQNFTFDLLQSTNKCSETRNLDCYDFIPNGAIPANRLPGGGRYVINSGRCQEYKNKQIFDNGCYKLVTKVLTSLPEDTRLIIEWVSRTNITFGACRNVFSHLFTQNWVNGTLYAFAFKNNKIFDNSGNITPEYCKDVIYFDDDTNNFYYRSSPYRTGTTVSNNGFVGKLAPEISNRLDGRDLMFPTTIMDLGPRADYIQELAFSDDYDGYVVNKLNSTSYQDVSELLNLLIITRLLNTSYRSIFRGTQGGNIFNYFARPQLTVDADYAQMISINSELGVVPFEAESYPSLPPLTLPQFNIDPVYFTSGRNRDVVFGIFYSSDTQIRDYITPKRTIINSQVMLNDGCAFNNFYCYSQEVPFYQWKIERNSDNNPESSIFGAQKNDWYKQPISGQFFHSHKYQSLDRASSLSRYFRSGNSGLFTDDFKGYIYSINRTTPPTQDFFTTPSLDPLQTSWQRNSPDLNTVTVGAPFYFYFGLKKGKSAWDRFAKKWINFENIR
jgi:hypothetical protein